MQMAFFSLSLCCHGDNYFLVPAERPGASQVHLWLEESSSAKRAAGFEVSLGGQVVVGGGSIVIGQERPGLLRCRIAVGCRDVSSYQG